MLLFVPLFSSFVSSFGSSLASSFGACLFPFSFSISAFNILTSAFNSSTSFSNVEAFSTFTSAFVSASGSLNKRFNKIPITAAKLIPEIVSERSPWTIETAAPPSPKTSIVDATTMFLFTPKLIWFSINTLRPLTAINPYSSNDTPPSTGLGIVETIAVNFPKKPNTIAIIAARPITHTEAIFVIPTTEVFSPYVVFAGPPIAPAINVAKPSPRRVLSNPGSFNKSFPIIVDNAVWSPMCSAIVTNAIGAIVSIAEKLGV